MGIGDLGRGEPGTAEAAGVGLSPVDVLLSCVRCLARCRSEKSHLGLSGYKASVLSFPLGKVASGKP